ncbi:branched-chain amino acid ABC transporter permease [Nocardioides insulae]|uniref:branched-chain amino acid ABC transporter permease n=1 Tax=Nocardioides insulae TaxID=394734 RepID=UPI0004072285|nr:branched-chain amino acid ABC transporter permease [Nocardioides insulae]
MTEFLESVLRGLGNGAIYALLALGFVIIYKSSGAISFAQPALMMTGAVISSYIAPALGAALVGAVAFFVSVTAAALVTALVAMAIERLAIRPMIGRAAFTIAIITIGIDIAVRVITSGFIGLGARPVPNPWGLERTEILGLRIQERHLVALGILALVVLLLVLFFRYTRHGLAMRATAFDQEAAMTQGISVGAVFSMSWAIAGALAAVAGTLLATSAGVDRQIWIVALVALPAIILGGLDSLAGAVIGGLAVGVVESLVGSYQGQWAPWLGNNFQVVAPYVLMFVVLLVRPYGLFGTPEVRRV